MADGRKKIDWEAVEREYRAGQLSVTEIARRADCTRGAIQNRAKRHGWTRDLSHEYRRETRRQLMAGVAGATQDGATDDEIVKSAAAQGVEVVRAHRKIIGQTMALAERLLQYAVSEEIEGKTHADIFRSISQGLAKVVPLERQAFSLDKDFGEQLGDGLKAGMTSFPPEPETVGQWIDLCKRMDAAVAGGAKK